MPTKRRLVVESERQGTYERTITSRAEAFSCERCGKETSRVQFPGRRPKYCLDCLPVVKAEQAAARQRRHRERAAQVSVTPEQVSVTKGEIPHPKGKQVQPKPRGKKRRR